MCVCVQRIIVLSRSDLYTREKKKNFYLKNTNEHKGGLENGKGGLKKGASKIREERERERKRMRKWSDRCAYGINKIKN